MPLQQYTHTHTHTHTHTLTCNHIHLCTNTRETKCILHLFLCSFLASCPWLLQPLLIDHFLFVFPLLLCWHLLFQSPSAPFTRSSWVHSHIPCSPFHLPASCFKRVTFLPMSFVFQVWNLVNAELITGVYWFTHRRTTLRDPPAQWQGFEVIWFLAAVAPCALTHNPTFLNPTKPGVQTSDCTLLPQKANDLLRANASVVQDPSFIFSG